MGPGHSISKIKGVKSSSLKKLFDYISNPSKTTLSFDEDISLTGEEIKEEGEGGKMLVSSHNCNLKTIKTEFELARESYYDLKKESLRPGERPNMAFHIIQSFEGRDYSPLFIHKLGQEFAKELLGDDFQAVIATHINTENYHNHIVFNAFNKTGDFKYHDKKETVARMREINDRISKRYGLEIIIDPDKGKSHSYKEYLEIKNGTSWKEAVRQDIKNTVAISKTFNEYKEFMEALGYTLTENKNSITYKVNESGLKVSDIKLGKEYTREELEKYFGKSRVIKEELDEMVKVKERKVSLYVSKYDINGRKRSLLELMFLKAIKILKKLKEILTTEEDKKNTDVKIQNLIDAMQKAYDLEIENREALLEKINEVGKSTAIIKAEKASLDEEIGNLREIYDAVKDYEDLKAAVEKIDVMKEDLIVKEFSPEDVRKGYASLYPMTGKQKKTLYTLLNQHKEYKLGISFEELSKDETKKVIDFLNGECKEKPSSLLTLEEFDIYKLRKKYDVAKERRLSAMKEKLSKPLTKEEREELIALTKDYDCDVLSATKYDLVRVKNYVNRKNPLLSPALSASPIDPQIKEQLIDLLKIYPSEDIGGISKNLDELDNERAKKLYNYLLEEGLVPEIITKNREDIYYSAVKDLTLDEQDICNRYRYAAETLKAYGVKEPFELALEIEKKEREFERLEKEEGQLSELYSSLLFIKRNEEFIRNDKYLYGDFKAEEFEINEVDSKDDEEYIKPKQKGMHI